MDFATTFKALTGNEPFPWQEALYVRFIAGDIPASCNLPTGLGKTSVIAIWLIALATHPDKMPRRLVYVVNRRTVVDQTTVEVEKYRDRIHDEPELVDRLRGMGIDNVEIPFLPQPLAISTLRGQFADNRQWSEDPSRPAVICGTVDMIGSRLLFSGYGLGFKSRPLHAGFLGQDALLVHDEAHLEPAFQELLIAIEKEQKRCKEFGTFHVMELTATSRGSGEVFKLSAADEKNTVVDQRINAQKSLVFHTVDDERKQLADKILGLCKVHKESNEAILVFVRTVESLNAVVTGLRKEKCEVQQLTGTLRGLERNNMADPRNEKACRIFARFLPPPKEDAPESERWKIEPLNDTTVFLVCTSAGEVGVNLSADHLVCDLSPFDSMAQRFGRVNRFGKCEGTRIDIVSPAKFDEKDFDARRKKTLALLKSLDGNGSPARLGGLDPQARVDAFSPQPTILPVTDILFDAWALTSIRDKLPGRPPVAEYLHGVNEWEPPQTKVAWREEVWELRREFDNLRDRKQFQKYATELLADYPLKNHELLGDRTDRILVALKKFAAEPNTPVWVLDDEDRVVVTTLGEVSESEKDDLKNKTILLPPQAGGLEKGLLDGASKYDSTRKDYDVADEWFGKDHQRLRTRIWDDDEVPKGMSIVDTIDTKPDEDADEPSGRRYWHRCAIDVEENKNNKYPVLWTVHVGDVVRYAKAIVAGLNIDEPLKQAVITAAEFHDHGKRRAAFQRVLGNLRNAEPYWAKSGPKNRNNKLKEDYRHEFGSLVDLEGEAAFKSVPTEDLKELIRHLIAVHHGFGRPHFPNPYDPDHHDTEAVACEVPRRYARLQRKYGRWGLAYLESLLRAADWSASANPSAYLKEDQS